MFGGLASAIDELIDELVDEPGGGPARPVDGDVIVELRTLADRLGSAIAAAEAAYAADGRFGVEGFASMATFVRHRCRTTLAEARRSARRAQRLAAWGAVAEAWRAGVWTGAQVDLACAIVPDRHVARFAETADDTIEAVRWLTAVDSKVALDRWVAVADAELAALAARAEQAGDLADRLPDAPPDGELSMVRLLDDELDVRARFADADDAAVVSDAIGSAVRADREGERRHPAQRRADALVDICRHWLATADAPDGHRPAGALTVVADIDVLYRAALRGAGVRTAHDLSAFLAAHPMAPLERGLFLDAFHGRAGGRSATVEGNPVGDGLLAAVSSGGTLELLLTAGAQPLHLGRRVRTFSPAQRRAVLARDQGCRAPGCDAPGSRCDIHHVVPWEAGGPTDVGNAVAKCRRCHLDHHRRRIADRIEPDGTYTIDPPGHPPQTTRPPGRADAPDPPPGSGPDPGAADVDAFLRRLLDGAGADPTRRHAAVPAHVRHHLRRRRRTDLVLRRTEVVELQLGDQPGR